MGTEGRIGLARLGAAFLWTGCTALGGGRTTYFHEALVVQRHWLSHEEFLQDLTLSQLLPGPNFSNLAVALGYRLGGAAGAVCGLAAVLLPGAVALLALTGLYFSRGVTPGVGAAMRGMGAAVVGLVLVTTLRLARGGLRGRGALLIAAATFVTVGLLRLPTAAVILGTSAASLWLNRPRGAGSAGPVGGGAA